MKLLIVGYGKMGRMVDDMAADQGFEVVGRVDAGRDEWRDADVAVDFSTAAALESNFQHYVDRRLRVVIGTTGWGGMTGTLQAAAAEAGLGVVAAPNFSIGVNVFQMMVEEAARVMKAHPQFGAWIHEAHHATKRDAPSGTALILRDAMVHAGFDRPIDMSSTRAGAIPGVHTIGFDGPSDTIVLTHTARDRRGFAAGALLAAKWIQGRTGWHTMQDVLRT
ncbi:MAG TPA: dihydrodipicolinate reductase C-terminal domain-containing protein [Vicinamibacterales bacterium]|nr:dihydrodipicolinate reductase C-terminal domain-containing protein [Vicinamibacterales bacterium]